MVIRAARVQDLYSMEPAAKAFYASSKFLRKFDIRKFSDFWAQWLTNGLGAIFVLEHEGRIVGALGALSYPEPYSGEMAATEMFWYVEPEYRGKGGELYRCFERWAKSQGCTQMRLVHLLDSMPERLAKVYRRWGYEAIETHYAKELK